MANGQHPQTQQSSILDRAFDACTRTWKRVVLTIVCVLIVVKAGILWGIIDLILIEVVIPVAILIFIFKMAGGSLRRGRGPH
jgi:hypothetical protein